MTLEELRTRVAETLNLEVITLKSLITMTNNCIADLLTRGYREFHQKEYTTDKNDLPLVDATLPLTITSPSDYRKLTYMKVETENNVFDAERISLGSDHYMGKKDADGNVRISFPHDGPSYLFYTLNGDITLDSKYTDNVKRIVIGYQDTIPRVPFDAELSHEIKVREEIEEAMVLYGVFFYVKRLGFDPEATKSYRDEYRYFVEDMLDALSGEDVYQGSTQFVTIKSIYSG